MPSSRDQCVGLSSVYIALYLQPGVLYSPSIKGKASWLMTRAIVAIICCTALGILSSCTTSPVQSEFQLPASVSSKERLDPISGRIAQQYPGNQFLIGIGQAESEKAATELARADLLKQIRAAIRVTWTDVLRERGGREEQDVSRIIETRVDEVARGIDIVERGKDPSTGNAYAVAVLPRSEVVQILHSTESVTKPLDTDLHEPQDIQEPIWVVVEGVIPFGSDTTLGEAKSRSRDEARRKAIEQAVGVFVKGRTIVYNAQVADDLVQSLVRGIVLEEQVIEEGVRQFETGAGPKAFQYATRLRAKVKPVRMERRGNFALKAELNKTVFSEGEEMQIRAVSTKDAYLHIFNVGQDDTVTVLLPSRYAQANLVSAQKEFVFPSDEQRSVGIRLKAFPPTGTRKAVEKIKLIATIKHIDLAQGKVPEGGFKVYHGKDTTFVTDLLKMLSLLDESEWTEVTIPYEVRK